MIQVKCLYLEASTPEWQKAELKLHESRLNISLQRVIWSCSLIWCFIFLKRKYLSIAFYQIHTTTFSGTQPIFYKKKKYAFVQQDLFVIVELLSAWKSRKFHSGMNGNQDIS